MRTAVLAVLVSAAVTACAPPIDGAGDDGDVTVIDGTGLDADAAAKNDLSVAQQKAVLLQLDNICGDTWCDGDWWFSFEKVTCQFGKGTCTTTELIYPSVADVHPLPTYWRSCKVVGLHQLSDLVTTAPNGYQSINQDYYEKMTDCVFAIVAKLPPAP